MSAPRTGLDRLPTGIPGLDDVTRGGLPRGRAVVVAGTAGSGKTVLGAQFLSAGIATYGQAGVFVTCEESPEHLRRNLSGFGWDVAAWEAAGRWAFVDATDPFEVTTVHAGAYDLTGLVVRIEAAIDRIGAQRVVIDSLDALFEQLPNERTPRRELQRALVRLNARGVTTVLTTERTREYGDVSQRGVAEFVADNLVLLRNVLTEEQRRRTLEVVKLRGADHGTGEFGFAINDAGITVIPNLDIGVEHPLTDRRIPSGIAALDAMCDGGYFADSVVLISGAAGTGKTLLMCAFVAAAAAQGERALLFAFEERREALIRNARGWGYDFEGYERDGALKIVTAYPEVATLEDHLVSITAAVRDFDPARIAVDSLSALERVASVQGFRKFAVSLTAFFKQRGVAALLTSTTPTFLGGASHTESHLSTVTDLIILLRHLEVRGALRRGLVVLKMRGSHHAKEVREFTVDGRGMHLGDPLQNDSGLLPGRSVHPPLNPESG